METNEHDMADPNTMESFVKESEFAALHDCLKNLLLDVLHASVLCLFWKIGNMFLYLEAETVSISIRFEMM